MTLLDWSIVVGFVAFLAVAAWRTRRHARSVSGFLSAERCGGRYLITVANNAAMVGVISLVWFFEQNYDVGFTTYWWQLMEGPALVIMALSGWVYYRYRQTRALTLAQFLEMRYSRRFRVFAGVVAVTAGIVNFGIFPGVGARFFIAMAGLPESYLIGGLEVSTFVTVMVLLLATSIAFVAVGGQVAIMVTDFLQGTFGTIVFMVVIAWLLWTIGWGRIETVLLDPEHVKMVQPFRLEDERNFDVWYYLIGVVVLFYGTLGWQGTAGYNTCAINAHEAKMANILNGWRTRVLLLVVLVLPLCVKTFLHHPDYAVEAETVQASLAALDSDQLRVQLRTPMTIPALLPIGLLGLVTAALLAAFISTHDTYLHSWGSMLMQDVVLPLYGKPISPAAHLWLLRGSIGLVAVFIFVFSLLYEPTQYVSMFLALTGSIFVAGAGSAIIGGLYWKRGSTPAAWTAMITGIVLSTGGVVIKQFSADQYVAAIEHAGEHGTAIGGAMVALLESAAWVRESVSGQWLSFIAVVSAIGGYVLVSLLGPRHVHDMDRLLHRGDHAIEGESTTTLADARSWKEYLGFSRDFTRGDTISTLLTIAWPVGWTVVFIVGTIYNLTRAEPVATESWLGYWRIWLWLTYAAAVAVTIWFTIGGLRDLRMLVRRLDAARIDRTDDGRVAVAADDDAATPARDRTPDSPPTGHGTHRDPPENAP